jgi:hypothetical protein
MFLKPTKVHNRYPQNKSKGPLCLNKSTNTAYEIRWLYNILTVENKIINMSRYFFPQFFVQQCYGIVYIFDPIGVLFFNQSHSPYLLFQLSALPIDLFFARILIKNQTKLFISKIVRLLCDLVRNIASSVTTYLYTNAQSCVLRMTSLEFVRILIPSNSRLQDILQIVPQK